MACGASIHLADALWLPSPTGRGAGGKVWGCGYLLRRWLDIQVVVKDVGRVVAPLDLAQPFQRRGRIDLADALLPILHQEAEIGACSKGPHGFAQALRPRHMALGICLSIAIDP